MSAAAASRSARAAALAAPRSPRYHALDLWRGIACLLVVVFHSTSVAFRTGERDGFGATDPVSFALLLATRVCWVGVPLFFVISGYAISATADVFRRRSGGAAAYFVRRLRRIYPPYWAMLVLQALLVLAIDVLLLPGLLAASVAPIERPWELSGAQWLGNLTLTESWRATVLPFRSDQQYALGQAWTLCYEEQFYLVTGLAILAGPARFFRTAALVTVVVLAVPLLAPLAGVRVAGLFLDGYWLAFASGILVYWQANYGERRHRVATVALLAAGLGYALVAFPGRGEIDRDVASAMLFAGLLLVLHRYDAHVPGSERLRPLAFLGTICYSLYLSHAVVVRALSQVLWDAGLRSPAATVGIVVPVCVVAAIVVGWGFHRAVERRFLNRPSTEPGAPALSAPPVAPGAPAAP